MQLRQVQMQKHRGIVCEIKCGVEAGCQTRCAANAWAIRRSKISGSRPLPRHDLDAYMADLEKVSADSYIVLVPAAPTSRRWVISEDQYLQIIDHFASARTPCRGQGGRELTAACSKN